MENATEALKMAFAVLVFVVALTIAISMFSRLNVVSKALISASDSTTLYQYSDIPRSEQFRTVGIENIIPTLYKYYIEKYTVVFLDGRSGAIEPLILYKSQIPNRNWSDGTKTYNIGGNSYKFSKTESNTDIFSFDMDEEIFRGEPWTDSSESYKKNLDCFLYGGEFKYNLSTSDAYGSAGSTEKTYNYGNGFVKNVLEDENIIIREMFGQYSYSRNVYNTGTSTEEDNERTRKEKKRVIIYLLENK